MPPHIPKVELHVHLEGTIRPKLGIHLAKKNHLNFLSDYINPEKTDYQFKNFEQFLKAYDAISNLIKSPQDYYDITYDYLKSSAQYGGIYCEMMYSPDHAEHATGIPTQEHLYAIIAAIEKAEHNFGIIGRIIITAVRHFGVEACEKVAKNALAFSHPYIVGFGLAGDELKYPPHLFKKTYAIAKEAGLQCTIHAGEFGSPESIIEAIRDCQVSRIGHGVRAIESIKALEYLKENRIALEICISSNIHLGLYSSVKEHPLPKLLEAGVCISLNTDDPPFMHTHIGKEYALAKKHFHLTEEQLINISKQAVLNSFADQKTKSYLLEQFTA